MAGRRLGAASGLLTLLLAGCSGPVGLYHSIQGGAIAQKRQPPPGYNLPYPNLANVPPAPKPQAPDVQARLAARVVDQTPGVSPPSPLALDGLTLPGAPPPVPAIAGLVVPALIPWTPPPKIVPPPPPTPPNKPPVALAFVRGSAVLPVVDIAPLRAVAAGRGQAQVLVGGFGDNSSLALAVARARRLADQLTADGVPPDRINLVASRDGSGGFVQLVY
jgi:hypothetical protein